MESFSQFFSAFSILRVAFESNPNCSFLLLSFRSISSGEKKKISEDSYTLIKCNLF